MNTADVQRLLASAGYYDGKADGVAGTKTRAAVDVVARNAERRGAAWPSNWNDARRAIAAGQAILNAQGYEAGLVDGLVGHNTREALAAWNRKQAGQPALVIDRTPTTISTGPATQWPRQAEMERVFGPAGGPRATAGIVRLPFPFVIAWDLSQRVSTFRAHELCAPAFQRVFEKAAAHYGEAEFRRLRLDLFGGCFNNRNMRDGTAKSTHAYGAAVDLDPDRNQLTWGRDRAAFARPEYDPFWRIVEAEGLVSLGRVRNMDFMHFQGARL